MSLGVGTAACLFLPGLPPPPALPWIFTAPHPRQPLPTERPGGGLRPSMAHQSEGDRQAFTRRDALLISSSILGAAAAAPFSFSSSSPSLDDHRVAHAAEIIPRANGASSSPRPSLLRPPKATFQVIAHRGACGYLPEHTLQAYRLAMDLGADYVEPDLVATSDGHLVCLHDLELSDSTNVAEVPEFRDRKRTVKVGGQQVTGFFSFDFTLSEIKTLRVKQRLRELRPLIYDGLFEVPTLEEVVRLVAQGEADLKRPIGIYAELKEPALLSSLGIDAESLLVSSISTLGLLNKQRRSSPENKSGSAAVASLPPCPLVLECFDPPTLRSLSGRLPSVPLVQLMQAPNSGTPDLSYGDLSFQAIARYASGLGLEKAVLTGQHMGVAQAQGVVREAQALGMAVHPWTFRKEGQFVSSGFGGDWRRELQHFGHSLGVDGVFVEQPDEAKQVAMQQGEGGGGGCGA